MATKTRYASPHNSEKAIFKSEKLYKDIKDKIKKDGPCHVWTGSFVHDRTPYICHDSIIVNVRRFLWYRHKKPVYTFKVFMVCNEKRCVNIEHMTCSNIKAKKRLGRPPKRVSFWQRLKGIFAK